MARGIIYLMRTVVKGLVKIGKTSNEQFENRMRNLENNGYANITGLKREFAIEVDSYDDKEKLLHSIFYKSRLADTELFAIDIDIVKSLLSSFDGKQIYPKDKTKKEVFKESSEEFELQEQGEFIPEGEYVLNRNVKGFGKVSGICIFKNKKFIVKKGSVCAPPKKNYTFYLDKNIKIKNNILQEDIECNSPSSAGLIIIGRENNGWTEWKDITGKTLDTYRKIHKGD